MASAPQNVTRAVARRTFAPPALAPIAPRRARKPKDAADTIRTSALAGDTTTMSKGMATPTANVAAEVNAACTVRRGGGFRNPKLIAGVCHQGIFCHQLLDDLPRKRLIDTALDVNVRQLIDLKFWTILQSCVRACRIGASLWACMYRKIQESAQRGSKVG
jgi:hypothetical protein